MKNYKFRHGIGSFYTPIFGIILLIFPIYKRYSEERDYLFIILYCLIILYFLIEIVFKIMKPLITIRNGEIVVNKYFSRKKIIKIERLTEIVLENSDIYLRTSLNKVKLDSKDINKTERHTFVEFINEIKTFNNI